MLFGHNEAKIFCPVHTDHWQTPQFRRTINVLTALTMSSFFEAMLIIRSLFTAEFIRAFFQSNRWFKIYTKFRVEPVGRSYKLHSTGSKALAVVQPSSRGCEPLVTCTAMTSPVLLLLHVTKHLYLRCRRMFYSAPFHTTESTAINPSLAIFRKSGCIVTISAYMFWLSMDRYLKEPKMLNSGVSSTIF